MEQGERRFCEGQRHRGRPKLHFPTNANVKPCRHLRLGPIFSPYGLLFGRVFLTVRHLTEKPAELAVRAIQYSSRPEENVLDLFGGSGSTLIGCEQTNRKAFLMEIDPLYCDVIVQRFETFTGKKGERHTRTAV